MSQIIGFCSLSLFSKASSWHQHQLPAHPQSATVRHSLRRPVSIAASAKQPRTFAAAIIESPWLTSENEILASNNLALRTDIEGLDLDGLNALFAKVGFQSRDKAKLLKALEHSNRIVWLCDATLEGEAKAMPIAFARTTGDDVFNAVVWDVAVEPKQQGKGLGRAVMGYLVASLLDAGITNICLYAETGVTGFYKPLGWCVDPDGVRGMAYRPPRGKK